MLSKPTNQSTLGFFVFLFCFFLFFGGRHLPDGCIRRLSEPNARRREAPNLKNEWFAYDLLMTLLIYAVETHKSIDFFWLQTVARWLHPPALRTQRRTQRKKKGGSKLKERIICWWPYWSMASTPTNNNRRYLGADSFLIVASPTPNLLHAMQ